MIWNNFLGMDEHMAGEGERVQQQTHTELMTWHKMSNNGKEASHTLATSHIFNVLSSDAVTSSLLSLDQATSEMP